MIFLFFLGLASWVLYVVGKYLFGNPHEDRSNARNGAILLWSPVLVFLGATIGEPFFGFEVPGSEWEKHEYEGEFYVNVFPKESENKNYRLPGMVRARLRGGIFSGSDYFLDYVRWPNGGRTTFSDMNCTVPLELFRKVWQSDDSNRDWYVELTNQRVAAEEKAVGNRDRK